MQVEKLVVVGAVEADPGGRDNALEQEVRTSCKHTFSRFQAVIRLLGLVDNPFTFADSKVPVPPTASSAAATYWVLRRRGKWSSEKTLDGYVQEGMYYLESLSLPTHVAELVADLSNLAPLAFHDTATRLPLQHRRSMSGKGSGGSCLSRHRAQCAGAETELYLGSVSEHLDLNS